MSKIIWFIAITFLVVVAAHADQVKVMKSQVRPTFAADVAAYSQELADWKAHMARVAADRAAGVPKEKAFAPYPAPVAEPSIMSAIDADGKPNYQIVDDSPSPEEVLASKKQDLILQVRLEEQRLKSMVLPSGKLRAFGFRQNSIVAADQARKAALLDAQPVGILSSIGIGAKKDLGKAEADAIAQRPPEDAKFMADQAVRQAKMSAIEHAAAQMESDIEDLTTSNIDSWSMPAFPN